MSAKSTVNTLRRRLLGVTFIVLVTAGITLSIANFNDAFTRTANVSLKTDEVGNQLNELSDVKARGVIIGHVEEIIPSAEGATLELALNPEQIDLVPADARAQILPKTLFGERFVSFEFEGTGTGPRLAEGDVIEQDRSESALELAEAFDSLLPTLTAVQPQKLNSTLTVMANTLEGRGEQLGDTLIELGDYFEEFAPHLPELQQNLANLAEFSGNLDEAVPDLASTFDNFAVSARTVVEQQEQLFGLYNSVITSSRNLETFLEANQDNIIALGETSRPSLELLAEYSPSFPCVIGQMRDNLDRVDTAFGAGTDTPGLRAEVVLTPNRGNYEAGQDEPEYNQFDPELGYRGPYCINPEPLPEPLPYPYPPLQLDDGSEHPPPARSELDGRPFPCDAIETFGNPIPEGLDCAPGTGGTGGGGSASGTDGAPAGGSPTDSPANTPGEHLVLSELVGAQTGMPAAEVPDWTGLLVGPLYRGAEVTVE